VHAYWLWMIITACKQWIATTLLCLCGTVGNRWSSQPNIPGKINRWRSSWISL
jgi:hypothetical protein